MVDITVDPEQCDRCGVCAACCVSNAIGVSADFWYRDSRLCNACLTCVQICPLAALECSG